MKIQPYLFFDGRCEEAINFYRDTIGAEVEMLMRFKDSPEGTEPCTDGAMPPPDKVMHATLRIGETSILASDGECKGTSKFEGFSLALECADEYEAETKFAALSQGGQVMMPLTETFFSPKFGMTSDKFGINWMILVAVPVS